MRYISNCRVRKLVSFGIHCFRFFLTTSADPLNEYEEPRS